MTISFTCTFCDAKVNATDILVGQKVPCWQCKTLLTVPQGTSTSQRTPAAAPGPRVATAAGGGGRHGHFIPSYGEKIVYASHPHWLLFAWPALVLILTVLIGVSLRFQTLLAAETTRFVALAVFVVGGFLALGLGILARRRYQSSKFCVTNKRLLFRDGVFNPQTLELLISQVVAVNIHQGVLGALFNCGSVTVIGIGGIKETYRSVRSPTELRQHVRRTAVA